MKYLFGKDKTVLYILSKSVDGKQDYQKHVVFVAWKDLKFQKSFQVLQTSTGFCLTFLTMKAVSATFLLVCVFNSK